MRRDIRGIIGIAVTATIALAGGCATIDNFYNRVTGASTAQPVRPDEFMQRQSTADQSETLNGDAQMPVTPAAARVVPVNQTGGIDSDVASVVQNHGGPATTQPFATRAPITTEPTMASGEYLAMGGVVADVNGSPIYINKVLQLVWPTLHNDARTMEAREFYNAAGDEIQKQILVLESDELLNAAAERNLDNNDHKLATDLTTAYRQKLITEAGGSVQEARLRAAANGDNFDDLVTEQHNRFMIEIYQQRKFSPLVEPGAQDLRVYYRQHVEDMFTQHSEATFDLITIDPSLLGGDTAAADRTMAFDRAKQAHDRAAAGVDFPTLFAEYNNDPGLKDLTNNTGRLSAYERGSFSKKEVEDAVWNLQPGQVTDVLEIEGVLYVAKLESRKLGLVRPFEDERVQETIASNIRRQRYAHYYDQDRQRLLDESVRHVYPEMLQTCLDMAMQSYGVWNRK